MIEKFILYIDALKRFTPTQFAYWIKNKYLHKIIFRSYPTGVTISEGALSKRIKNTLATFRNTPVWDFGITENRVPNLEYYQILKDELTTGRKQQKFGNLWQRSDYDPEMEMNFQRFYLFDKAFKELQLGKEQQLQLMVQWINQHLRKRGVAWSGFNCAIRTINWLKILYYIRSDSNQPELTRYFKIIQQSIFEQSLHNYRHIEHHIPGNHVLFQYISLWLVYQVWPEWEEQPGRLTTLENKLSDEVKKEFKSNGFHFELSSHYHVQATLFCLIWFDIKDNLDLKNENEISGILIKAINVIGDMLLPDDSLPLIGDNCYPFWHDSLNDDIANIRQLALHHFNIDIFRKQDKTVELKNDWLIHRNGQQHVMMDVGRVGLSANPGHGHGDLLSIIYSDAGQPLFIDPGTYLYSNDDEAIACKETVHHNTLSLNGNNQAKLWGFFRWAYLPSKPIYKFENKKNGLYIQAQFNGYHHKKSITHKRIIDCKSDELLIIDEIIDHLNGEQDLFLNFILHPDLNVYEENNSLTLTNKNHKWKLICAGSGKISTCIKPIKIYPAYNVVKSSHKIIVRNMQGQFPAKMETRITRM